MPSNALQVGDLARRTGLTVRSLHHYDAIGLLKPSLHSDAGYRLYTAADVARLQQILSLRQLGFSLDEIRDCLDRSGFSPLEVIDLHLARLREQLQLQQKLCQRLESLALHVRSNSAETVSADEFLGSIQEMTMLEALQEKYFTPDQLQTIKDRRHEAGHDQLERGQEQWAELIAALRTEMDNGTDPASPKVQALAARWQELLQQSTCGDPQIQASMKKLWEEQGDQLAAQFGAKYDSRPVWAYVTKAIAVGKA
jgi:DNA-binding transcriptional MerR regulator